jgi:hypothetical protein
MSVFLGQNNSRMTFIRRSIVSSFERDQPFFVVHFGGLTWPWASYRLLEDGGPCAQRLQALVLQTGFRKSFGWRRIPNGAPGDQPIEIND